MRSKYFDILLSELSVRCPANEVKWPGSLIEFIAPNYFENIWAMLSPVTPRPTAPRCHLNHCQSLISSLCFRSRVLSEHQSSWLPRWSAMTSSALAQVKLYVLHIFKYLTNIFTNIFCYRYLFYSFARISKFLCCRHVVPGCDLLHPAVRLLALHGRQRHGDLQQYQQVRAVEFISFKSILLESHYWTWAFL